MQYIFILHTTQQTLAQYWRVHGSGKFYRCPNMSNAKAFQEHSWEKQQEAR